MKRRLGAIDPADFGLRTDARGLVTLYHGTTKAGALRIKASKQLCSVGEPDVYLTTDKTGAGYGDGTVIAVKVDPRRLELDDEFPGGRFDFRINTKRPRGCTPIALAPKKRKK